jgi:hypothetical protein
MDTAETAEDRFAHLRQRASERAERTVQRIRAGISALQASDRSITAESLKQVTRELEPGFPGLSFQVVAEIRVLTGFIERQQMLSRSARPTKSVLANDAALEGFADAGCVVRPVPATRQDGIGTADAGA